MSASGGGSAKRRGRIAKGWAMTRRDGLGGPHEAPSVRSERSEWRSKVIKIVEEE